MSETGNGFEYRFRKLEDALTTLTKRVDSIDEHGSRRVGVIEADMRHLAEQIGELSGEIRDLRADMRDTRHRLTAVEASVGNVTKAIGDANAKVDGQSDKVDGLVKSIVASVLSLGVLVIGSIVTMWLALGGPP